MKKLLLTITLILLGAPSVFANGETFGPAEWTQYRMNPENNPVFHSKTSGEINRIIDTDDQIRSTPVIVGDNIFIGNNESGGIYSYNLKTNEYNWKSKAPNWIHSEIIYVNDQLFVGYGNRITQENGTRGTGESGLLSLDPKTGEILWNYKTPGEVMPTPAVDKDTVYITTGDKHLYAINPKTGEERWRLYLGSNISMSSPNIKNGVLYVGGGAPRPYTFYAVDLESRKLVWKREFEDVYAGLDDVPPSIYKNKYVFTTALEETGDPSKPNHMIYAMDIKTGDVVWEESLGTGEMVKNNKSGAPIVYEDAVFVGSPITKTFYSFDAKTGKQLWNYPSNVNKAPPVADKGIVYFADTKGIVYAFKSDSGKLLGKKELGGKLAPAGPVLMNDHLIVGSQDSNVYIVPITEILEKTSSLPNGMKVEKAGFSYKLPLLFAGLFIVGIFLIRRLKMKY